VDAAGEPGGMLLLGHGAGGGVQAADLEWLARRLPAIGTTVVRIEQPWRTAGGRVAVPPPRLDVGWRAAAGHVLTLLPQKRGPLLFGGRSAGARVACRTAPEFGVAGVVCLAFPLHLPGRPEKSRASELLSPTVPRLVLQGTKDTFGSAAEIRAVAGGDPGVVVVELPGADHGFRVSKSASFSPAQVRERVVTSVQQFIEVLRGNTVEESAL
jgi:uncharacterized protein